MSYYAANGKFVIAAAPALMGSGMLTLLQPAPAL
jgi:hypothetical protein